MKTDPKSVFSKIEPRYMMATTAIHQLGDISSDLPDICSIYGENAEDWVGSWVTGFGFFNVHYPKATTRELTQAEAEYYGKQSYQIGSQPPFKLGIASKAEGSPPLSAS